MRKLNFAVAASVAVGCGFVASMATAAPVQSRGEAHICSTHQFSPMAAADFSGTAVKPNLPKAQEHKFIKLDDATVFECPAPIGDKTIPQLAADGWHIGNPKQVASAANVGGDIAARGGPPLFTWKILIQRKP